MKETLKILLYSTVPTALFCLLLYILKVPNPGILSQVVVTFFLFKYGFKGGIPSGIIAALYSLINMLIRCKDNTYCDSYELREIYFLISLTLLVVMVGLLHKRNEKTKTQLRRLAFNDSLTNIYNRNAFNKISKNVFNVSKRLNKELTVLLIDIDFFKTYNDTYGHLVGDIVLKKVAHTIKKFTKRSTDFVFRYGGDEFIVLLMDTKDAKHIANSICNFIPERNSINKYTQNIELLTVSIGCYTDVPKENESIDDYIKKADLALYEAKKCGHNCVKEYKKGMEPKRS